MKVKYQTLQLMMLVFISMPAYSQITISGPACAVSGTQYQYIISGQWDSTTTMQVCVTSGSIQNSTGDSLCTSQGSPVNSILVQWDDSNADTGTVVVTSSAGNATYYVTFTQPLLPGLIDSASRVQLIQPGTVPAAINCLPDSGGSCSPAYAYQWQQSYDQVIWQDITGATGSSLGFDSSVSSDMYYRRKVTETVSGTIGYSDVASVFIIHAADSSASDSGGGTGFNYLRNRFSCARSIIPCSDAVSGPATIAIRKDEAEGNLQLIKTNCNA